MPRAADSTSSRPRPRVGRRLPAGLLTVRRRRPRRAFSSLSPDASRSASPLRSSIPLTRNPFIEGRSNEFAHSRFPSSRQVRRRWQSVAGTRCATARPRWAMSVDQGTAAKADSIERLCSSGQNGSHTPRSARCPNDKPATPSPRRMCRVYPGCRRITTTGSARCHSRSTGRGGHAAGKMV